ncbi:MAG: hypothetical protein M1816_005968 [Peltula sp. TS41687]|nr:MAG: hypothetical protein M1816_005968 [Peltula sp. TS41687]
MEDFAGTVIRDLNEPLEISKLLDMSNKIQIQFKDALAKVQITMLPSYLYQLPTGLESGTYLVIDVGGSILRLALVELEGRDSGDQPMKILKMDTWKLDAAIKALIGPEFFDWIALKLDDFLANMQESFLKSPSVISLGLAWAYPVEQTSVHSGKILAMGKGFDTSEQLIGQDLRDLMMDACHRRKLNISLDAIVNDSAATFLSTAYLNSSAKTALILGTGVNAAVVLPINVIAPEKFGSRPERWYQKAKNVLVNTELSVFGGGILPMTIWDRYLNDAHPNPGVQPLEYLVGGRYLAEIVRLILLDAVGEAGLFEGKLPRSITAPYSLETETIGEIERDETPDLQRAREILEEMNQSRQVSPPTNAELHHIQKICEAVSRRAGAYLATALHALRMLQHEVKGISPAADKVIIGCHGSVIQKYPGLLDVCQTHLDQLTVLSGGTPGAISLTYAADATIFGAAVAVNGSKKDQGWSSTSSMNREVNPADWLSSRLYARRDPRDMIVSPVQRMFIMGMYPGVVKPSGTLREEPLGQNLKLRRRLTRFLNFRAGMTTHFSPVTYSTLKANFK